MNTEMGLAANSTDASKNTGQLIFHVEEVAQTRALGEELAKFLRAGDLVLLSGELGAGKTTFTQGIGLGLGVRGQVASPTFIVARVHPSEVGGPSLIHVDAYRIGDLDDLETLDLDSSLADSVTVIEWGKGKVEALSGDRLEIEVLRARGADDESMDSLSLGSDGVIDLSDLDDGARTITVSAVGRRWVEQLDKLAQLHF